MNQGHLQVIVHLQICTEIVRTIGKKLLKSLGFQMLPMHIMNVEHRHKWLKFALLAFSLVLV